MDHHGILSLNAMGMIIKTQYKSLRNYLAIVSS